VISEDWVDLALGGSTGSDKVLADELLEFGLGIEACKLLSFVSVVSLSDLFLFFFREDLRLGKAAR